MTDTAPSLSVIIISTAPLDDMPVCLRTVRQQCHGRRVEIILAYSADHAPLEARASDYPDVTLIRLPQATNLPRLLGAAIARARGAVIAITDATCEVDMQWVSAILRAHHTPHPIIGGAVEPDGLRTLADWTAYFCDYGRFMLPLAPGVAQYVPGINFSVKRQALESGSEFVTGEFWKGHWCLRLQAAGVSLQVDPAIVVFYRKSFSFWSLLQQRFHHGRCFAGMRLAQLTPARRIVYVLGSLALPILLCVRIVRAVLPKRRCLRLLTLSLPLMLLDTGSWALGEFCGYLAGPGTSCQHVR